MLRDHKSTRSEVQKFAAQVDLGFFEVQEACSLDSAERNSKISLWLMGPMERFFAENGQGQDPRAF